jgi:hypothetical protein
MMLQFLLAFFVSCDELLQSREDIKKAQIPDIQNLGIVARMGQLSNQVWDDFLLLFNALGCYKKLE